MIQEYLTDALPVNMIGMNKQLMCEYIQFVADHLMIELGYNKATSYHQPFNVVSLCSDLQHQESVRFYGEFVDSRENELL